MKKPRGRQRGAGRLDRQLRLGAARLGLVVGLVVIWEGLTRSGLVSSPAVVPGSEVLRTAFDVVGEAATWTALGQTLISWFTGLALCALIGVPVGALLGSRKTVYATVRVVLEFLRATPPVVVIPFVLLFFGPTQEMKIVLIVLGAVWPLLVQTMYGVHDLDPVMIETARAYRMRGWPFARSVALPGVLPYVITGARISAVLALLLAIGSEMITSAPGLGREILFAQTNGATRVLYGLILIAGLLGITLNMGFARFEKWALHWHPSQRTAHS